MTEEKPAKPPRATLEQKIKILDYYQQSQRPQLDTVEKFKDEVAISTSTFNEWVKHQAEYRKRYHQLLTEFQKNSKRKITYKYDRINRAMDLLVQQRLARGESVTEPVLRGYWQVYAHQFGVDNPKRLIGFSHGWLSQFKKRHGIARRKEDGKLVPVTANENDKRANDREPEKPRTQFQPQQTLSFRGQYPYYEDGSVRDRLSNQSGQTQSANGKPGQNTASSAPLDLGDKISPADVEKFIFSVADRFFQDNQYLYPQTLKIYQEFKSSFLSERLIDLRATKGQPVGGTQVSGSQLVSGTPISDMSSQISLSNHRGQNHSQSLQHSSQLHIQSMNMDHLNNMESMPIPNQVHHQMSGQLSQQLAQSDNMMEMLRSRTRKQKPKQKKSKYDPALQPLPLPQLLLLHRLHPLARDGQNGNQQRDGANGPSIPNMAQGNIGQASIGQGNIGQSNIGQSNVGQTNIGQDNMGQGNIGQESIGPENIGQGSIGQGGIGQTNYAHGDVRDGLEEMFTREGGRYEGQWPKSALRKIWEQNKIMLS